MELPRIKCPAGDPIYPADGVVGCRCLIEHMTLDPRRDPATLAAFCTSSYTQCPSWRTMKEKEWSDAAEARKFRKEIEASAKAEE